MSGKASKRTRRSGSKRPSECVDSVVLARQARDALTVRPNENEMARSLSDATRLMSDWTGANHTSTHLLMATPAKHSTLN